MTREQLHHVTNWLNDLAALTVGNGSLEQASEKAAALASIIAEDFPNEAFNRRSLKAVAEKCRYFPGYSDLLKLLGIWWRDNRAMPTAIAGPDDGLSADDRAHLAVWLKRRNAGAIADLRRSLAVLAQHRPAIYAHLAATDDQVRRIVWPRPLHPVPDAAD